VGARQASSRAMTAVRARDLRRLLDLTADLLDSDDLDGFRSLAAARLGELVPGEFHGCTDADLVTGAAAAACSAPDFDDDAEMHADFARHMHENPVLVQHARTGDGMALAVSDLLPRRRWRHTAVWSEVYRRQGFDDQLAAGLVVGGGRAVGLQVNREWAGFSERDRAMLECARPVLGAAYRRVARADEARALQVTLLAALRTQQAGVVLLDGRGGVEHADDHAVAVLEAWLGAPAAPGLPPLVERWLAGGEPTLELHDGPRRLEVRRLDAAGGWPGRALVVRETGIDPVTRGRELGLTPREGEVLAALAEGLSPTEAAERLGMAPATARKHLERIYARLDVSTMSAAVARYLAPRRARRDPGADAG
jgi:DNA-binding CsgD family transcriptional regulator